MSIKELESHLLSAKGHIEQFNGGTKVSATRARASLQALKKEADNLRRSLLDRQKNMPRKERKKKKNVDGPK